MGKKIQTVLRKELVEIASWSLSSAGFVAGNKMIFGHRKGAPVAPLMCRTPERKKL